MAYSIAELKKDMFIIRGGVPYKVVESQHTKMGRGGAVAKTKLKNLIDGSVLPVTYAGQDKVEPAVIDKIDMQYLYQEGKNLLLMDLKTYDQFTVDISVIGDSWQYLPPGIKVIAVNFNGRIIDLELPAKVELKVTEADIGVRGDTAKAATKLCTVETGAKVAVPLFVKVGDTIRIDSHTGTYLERKN